jgi:hypothetical protein
MDDLVMITLVLGASALAITLLVVLNIILGGWSPARLRTEEEAAAALAEGVFGFEAAAPITLAADGQGALALERGGARLGLAVSFGDRITVRALRTGEVRGIDRDGARLSLHLNDYTLPVARLRLADAETAQAWQTKAEGFIVEPASAPGDPSHA